jgi:hypothetical protein|tara:strand:- start:313 stop:480 length:168 start_codon:yes stop_codon:yes gene_type:complete
MFDDIINKVENNINNNLNKNDNIKLLIESELKGYSFEIEVEEIIIDELYKRFNIE